MFKAKLAKILALIFPIIFMETACETSESEPKDLATNLGEQGGPTFMVIYGVRGDNYFRATCGSGAPFIASNCTQDIVYFPTASVDRDWAQNFGTSSSDRLKSFVTELSKEVDSLRMLVSQNPNDTVNKEQLKTAEQNLDTYKKQKTLADALSNMLTSDITYQALMQPDGTFVQQTMQPYLNLMVDFVKVFNRFILAQNQSIQENALVSRWYVRFSCQGNRASFFNDTYYCESIEQAKTVGCANGTVLQAYAVTVSVRDASCASRYNSRAIPDIEL